jgi:1-acyl-sn-glycerol-3-phosphate acyltransferase
MPVEMEVPPISGFTSRFFARVVRRYFRSHFRSVMAANLPAFEGAPAPLIVYGNHVSWWDPMLILLLARTFMPERRHYAPMQAEQLERYPILRKIGIFPVDTTSGNGVGAFLRTSEAILKSGGVLWITPQARFADVREFPLRFKAGLGMVAARVPGITLLPLAVEYVFWDERMPEALARFGEPFVIDPALDRAGVTAALENALASVMLELQKDSMARDATRFRTVITGRRGTGGVYGMLQRVRGRASGKFQRDHTERFPQ